LRAEWVQAIAVLEFLLARWREPPDQDALHLSTLIEQCCQQSRSMAR
jgi:hypothetical protein